MNAEQSTPPGAATPERFFQHGGLHYVTFLKEFRQYFNVSSYFEIGSRAGQSLEPVTCDTISVDPEFLIEKNVIGSKKVSMFFQMTSDAFFAQYRPDQLLGRPLDVAFLDGLHIYEYLLRDFINTEKCMKRNGVVFMHDCLPMIFGMTAREQRHHTGGIGWTGDVWKVVPILRKYRPDLQIHLLDCPPTGLVMVTGLNPASTVLEENYYRITTEFAESPDDAMALREFASGGGQLKTRDKRSHAAWAKYCWL